MRERERERERESSAIFESVANRSEKQKQTKTKLFFFSFLFKEKNGLFFNMGRCKQLSCLTLFSPELDHPFYVRLPRLKGL